MPDSIYFENTRYTINNEKEKVNGVIFVRANQIISEQARLMLYSRQNTLCTLTEQFLKIF